MYVTVDDESDKGIAPVVRIKSVGALHPSFFFILLSLYSATLYFTIANSSGLRSERRNKLKISSRIRASIPKRRIGIFTLGRNNKLRQVHYIQGPGDRRVKASAAEQKWNIGSSRIHSTKKVNLRLHHRTLNPTLTEQPSQTRERSTPEKSTTKKFFTAILFRVASICVH